jgi:hypothetical protein
MTKAIVLQLGLHRSLSCLCTQMLHLLRSPLGHEAGESLCDGCPQLVEADVRALTMGSGYDPESTKAALKSRSATPPVSVRGSERRCGLTLRNAVATPEEFQCRIVQTAPS